MQNLGLKTSILGKFRGKIGIVCTHTLLCRKFATVEKLQVTAPLPSIFFYPTTLLPLAVWHCLRHGRAWHVPLYDTAMQSRFYRINAQKRAE